MGIATLTHGEGPLVAAAIHDGHGTRPEVAGLLAVGEEERLREEDPFTEFWTTVAPSRIIGLRSRFEVDLNRPRDKAVYRVPEDAWGLQVWRGEVPEEIVQRSLEEYDAFYADVERLLSGMARRHGRFVVLDLHSYNHRRAGPDGPPADAEGNPEVNLGTGSMDREYWAPVVERFMRDLHEPQILGRGLDVRENVKFRGGHFSKWIHETFPEAGCCLAIEFKKSFMDEWTGKTDARHLEMIRKALAAAIPGILGELSRLG